MSAGHTKQPEQIADAAFGRYVDELNSFQRLCGDPAATSQERATQAQRAGKAWARFLHCYRMLDAEMTPEMERERARLTVEAAALWAGVLVTGIILGGGHLIGLLVAAPCGWWAVNLAKRYAAHVRRRAGL